MKIIFHIGSGKTGTSAIQDFLRLNQNFLEEDRCAFLGRMLQIFQKEQTLTKLPWQKNGGWQEFLRTPHNAKEFEHILLNQISILSGAGYRTFVISNEGLIKHGQLFKLLIENLQDKGYTVEIIYVYRRVYDYILSAYSQWGIKHKIYDGKLLPFVAWLRQFDYSLTKYAKEWCENVGKNNFKVIKFSKGQDIIPLFLSAIGMDSKYYSETPSIEIRSNLPLNNLELFFYATYNSHHNKALHPQEIEMALRRLDQIDHHYRAEEDLDINLLIEDDLHKIVDLCHDEFVEANEFFAELNIDSMPDHLQDPIVLPRRLLNLELKNNHQIHELISSLVSLIVDINSRSTRQDKELRYLKNQINYLRSEVNNLKGDPHDV